MYGTGIGGTNTAHALTCALQAFRPALVLQLGVGGGYPDRGLKTGDLALATEECYGDVGVRTAEGWEPAETIGIPLLSHPEDFYNRFPLDPDLVRMASSILAGFDWRDRSTDLRSGSFVTVQECSGSDQLGRERSVFFGAICENMEGAAAAHLCTLYQLPFLELRGISNQVEDRNTDRWDLPLAAAVSQRAALHLLGAIDRIVGS